MLNQSSDTAETFVKRQPLGFTLVAGLTAVLITSILLVGYAYLMNRHVRQTAASIAVSEPAPANLPSGPPQVQVLVDDVMLKAGETTIGGTVKNISGVTLTNLSVELELYPRSGKIIDQAVIKLEPDQLEPQQEGRYMLKVKAKDYSAARLLALRAGNDSMLIAYTTFPGQKRPREKIEPEMVPANRQAGQSDEFLNTPDNPARVP
ncbi:MAG TPA: FxLYD domain-containing protein [Pyrinomonadaceae bacterium]|nr:FxLYD domain-containing protein [Pyrinomonadaceae bacterium]